MLVVCTQFCISIFLLIHLKLYWHCLFIVLSVIGDMSKFDTESKYWEMAETYLAGWLWGVSFPDHWPCYTCRGGQTRLTFACLVANEGTLWGVLVSFLAHDRLITKLLLITWTSWLCARNEIRTLWRVLLLATYERRSTMSDLLSYTWSIHGFWVWD